MVVRDLNIVRSVLFPDKADAILIVDANAVLTSPVSLQSLQLVSGRKAQVAQVGRGFELVKLTAGNLVNRCPVFAKPRFKELPCLVVLEAPDHCRQNITDRVTRQAAFLPLQSLCRLFLKGR